MKILVHSQYADSMGIILRLKDEGHDARVFIKEKSMRDSGKGMIEQFDSMIEGAKWKPDLVMFDFTKEGKLADDLRKAGMPVWGGSDFADQLERDRKFGSDFAKKCGIQIPETVEFNSLEEARAHVTKEPKAYVIKLDGDASAASSYVSKSAEDMLDYLDYLDEEHIIKGKTVFILQEKIEGVEISSEAWFSQGEPVPPFNHTFETKRFMPGDFGPNTGCETSVVFPIYGHSKMIEKTLSKCFSELKKIRYTGHFDINCIVSEKDKEPKFLEWTPRFGYSSVYATLAMMEANLGEMYLKLAKGELKTLPIVQDWGTSLRMSIPPYPYEEDAEIFKPTENQRVTLSNDKKNVWIVNVKKDEKRLKTSGFYGVVAECTGQGKTLFQAWKKSQRVFDETEVPSKQGRFIDGIDSATKRIEKLRSFGYEMPLINPIQKHQFDRRPVAKAA